MEIGIVVVVSVGVMVWTVVGAIKTRKGGE